MRKYIRHPSDIPIEFEVEGLPDNGARPLRDVGDGGLSFSAPTALPVGAEIVIVIPLVRPPFRARCRVSWCRREAGQYHIGLEFLDPDNAYRARMVEQVCHIEHYKREVQASEGRELSGQQAALEWIAKFAKDFP